MPITSDPPRPPRATLTSLPTKPFRLAVGLPETVKARLVAVDILLRAWSPSHGHRCRPDTRAGVPRLSAIASKTADIRGEYYVACRSSLLTTASRLASPSSAAPALPDAREVTGSVQVAYNPMVEPPARIAKRYCPQRVDTINAATLRWRPSYPYPRALECGNATRTALQPGSL